MNRENAEGKIPDPPRGMKAIPWRLPIWLYRLKLGWLLGHRMLLLNHVGRISGIPRQAVLEVIKYDRAANVHYVASGFGEKSDWYRNIRQTPAVTIQVGGRRYAARAECLESADAEDVFREYTQKHPNAIKNLGRLVGYELGESEAEMGAFLTLIPVVGFYPVEGEAANSELRGEFQR